MGFRNRFGYFLRVMATVISNKKAATQEEISWVRKEWQNCLNSLLPWS